MASVMKVQMLWNKFSNITSKDVYLGHCQTSMMKLFAEVANSFQQLTIFVKSSILDVWMGSEYAIEKRLSYSYFWFFVGF